MKFSQAHHERAQSRAGGFPHLCGPIACLDFETASFDHSSVIEVGVVVLHEDGRLESHHRFCDPGSPATAEAFAIHGIEEEDYRGEERPEVVLRELLPSLKGIPVVAHNARGMEGPVLDDLVPGHGLELIDSLLLSRLLLPLAPSHALEKLMTHLGIEREERHRAVEDSVDTLEVLSLMLGQAAKHMDRKTVLAMADDLRGTPEGEFLSRHAQIFQVLLVTVPVKPEPALFETESASIEEILGKDGLGQILDGWRPRKGQVDAARHMRFAFASSRIRSVEAPTGTGKSLAALVALAVEFLRTGRRGLYATHTKALQQQLRSNDIPILRRLLGVRVAILVGRANYVCKAAVKTALKRGSPLPPAGRAFLRAFAAVTSDGDTSGIGFGIQIDEDIQWQKWHELVVADSEVCRKNDREHADCFHSHALDRAASADIVLANHALVLDWPSGLLRPEFLVLDEAHEVPHVIREHGGARVSHHDVARIAGLAKDFEGEEEEALESLGALAERLLRAESWLQDRKSDEPIVPFEERRLAPLFRELKQSLTAAKDVLFQKGHLVRRRRELRLAQQLMRGLGRAFFILAEPGQFGWFAGMPSSDPEKGVLVAPRYVGPLFRRLIADEFAGVTLLSATMGTSDRPDAIARELGLARLPADRVLEHVSVADPFDRDNNQVVVTIRGVPGGRASDAHSKAVRDVTEIIARELGGRTMLYSPSRSRRDEHARDLAERLQDSDISLAPMAPVAAARRMRDDAPLVAVGTDGMGLGIDVPGEGLQAVVIEKIPFAFPGLIENARSQGFTNSFMAWRTVSLRPALIKLRQVAGRLLRRENDRGLIVLVDPVSPYKRYHADVSHAMGRGRHVTVDFNDIENRLPKLICSVGLGRRTRSRGLIARNASVV